MKGPDWRTRAQTGCGGGVHTWALAVWRKGFAGRSTKNRCGRDVEQTVTGQLDFLASAQFHAGGVVSAQIKGHLPVDGKQAASHAG